MIEGRRDASYQPASGQPAASIEIGQRSACRDPRRQDQGQHRGQHRGQPAVSLRSASRSARGRGHPACMPDLDPLPSIPCHRSPAIDPLPSIPCHRSCQPLTASYSPPAPLPAATIAETSQSLCAGLCAPLCCIRVFSGPAIDPRPDSRPPCHRRTLGGYDPGKEKPPAVRPGAAAGAGDRGRGARPRRGDQ